MKILYHGVRYKYGRSGNCPIRKYPVGQTIHYALPDFLNEIVNLFLICSPIYLEFIKWGPVPACICLKAIEQNSL